MYLMYHSLSLNFTLLIPSTGSVRKKVLPIHHSTYSFFLTQNKIWTEGPHLGVSHV